MENKLSAQQILDMMLSRDHFSRWLGLKIDDCAEGYCKLHFSVLENMLNGFGNIHGGVLFSASDSAFAFACNSHGSLTVALDVSMSFTRPVKLGERLTVEAKEIYLGNKIGIYDIRTTNEQTDLVAIFKGTGYRTSQQIL